MIITAAPRPNALNWKADGRDRTDDLLFTKNHLGSNSLRQGQTTQEMCDEKETIYLVPMPDTSGSPEQGRTAADGQSICNTVRAVRDTVRENSTFPLVSASSQANFIIPPTTASARWFLEAIYGQVAGWIELAWIDGDPDAAPRTATHPDGYVFGRAWFPYHPGQCAALSEEVAALAERHGNVYVSAHVYKRPKRDAAIKPGRVVVVDDLPAEVDCTFYVQTSPTSRHGYFLLDADASAAVLHDLGRRAATALKGDASGSDLQQLVRVPQTWNTKAKHGGHAPVTLGAGMGRAYQREELTSMWPEVAPLFNVDCGEVAAWQGNRADLLNGDGLPRRWKNPRVPGWRVLRGDLVPPSTSEARYIVVSSLVTHGYPDAEILVLARHLADFDAAARKGSAWLDTDILRCIGKTRAQHAVTPSPTRQRGTQPAQPLSVVPRPKKGRKITLTPEVLRAFYEQERSFSDVVLLTVGKVAERLGVSRATVERCERVLRADGVIERRFFNWRQSSLVVMLRPVTNHLPPQSEHRTPDVPTPEADPRPVKMPTAARTGEQAQDALNVNADLRPVTIAAERTDKAPAHVPSAEPGLPQPNAESDTAPFHGETHPRDGAALPRCPTLRDAVTEALAHFAQQRRITRQMVVMFVESKYPTLHFSSAALARVLTACRQRHRWDKQLANLRTTPYGQLARLSRKLDRLLVEGPDVPQGGQYGWACALAPHVSAERERRAAMNERADPRRVRQQRDECLRLVEQDRQQRRREQTSRSAPGRTHAAQRASVGVCSSPALPAQCSLWDTATPTVPSAAQLIAHLKQLKAERDARDEALSVGSLC